jgi:hypothetical protein
LFENGRNTPDVKRKEKLRIRIRKSKGYSEVKGD